MAAYKSLQEERAEAQHQKHLVFATETAWLMVGFAERAVKYRQDTDGAKVPKAQYRCGTHFVTAAYDIAWSNQPLSVVVEHLC